MRVGEIVATAGALVRLIAAGSRLLRVRRERELSQPQPVKLAGTVVTAALLIGAAFLFVCLLVLVWPGSGDEEPPTLNLRSWSLQLTQEAQLFAVVLLSGAIGGIAHSIRSLYWYVGNRQFISSWILMYFALPVMGSLFAFIVYLVLRGGFTTTLATSGDVNPYGIAAVSTLVGLFSRETAMKLKAVFDTLLTPADKGKDQAVLMEVSGFSPESGKIGTAVSILGSGLSVVTSVRFGSTPASPVRVSDTELTVSVPAGATSGPIQVIAASGQVAGPKDFTVIP